MSSEASGLHKIDLAAKKVELEKESEILQGKILEKERDILRLETEQEKEQLDLLFEMSEVLQQTENKKWVSATIAFKIIRSNPGKYSDLFEMKDGKAYIVNKRFKELEHEFFIIKGEMNEFK
ncbi:hypothetical protein ABEV78_21135 [Bacillus licheniformis]|uniref:hypothetical protein n=1 Tax=Bacillus TaxID=1386 RepID=UPI0009B79C15|nr:hypothetical protein [Bacillus licheniformis]ARC67964.1 hypothetical protein B34_00521 [Bacillus licheniformis]MDE1421457.1 hypothetical protein [Bacillus licheniformis]TWL68704.1 hypothetical protein CHCC15318_1446 [Bacillus licheniformis]TWM57135.1 hypothetical protein CHCC14813_2202 [Bacillus licheniformis]TWM60276.1 hypothetical protein CHCC14810_0933 [Bacillus licheniformis]